MGLERVHQRKNRRKCLGKYADHRWDGMEARVNVGLKTLDMLGFIRVFYSGNNREKDSERSETKKEKGSLPLGPTCSGLTTLQQNRKKPRKNRGNILFSLGS